MKPITAIVVLVLVASLAAGCTVNTTLSGNTQASSVSTAYPTAGRSALLQGIETSCNKSAANHQYEDYSVAWMNNTTMTIHLKITSETEVTMWDYKFTHFPTIEAATAYFDGHQLEYPSTPDTVDHASLYAHVTGVKNASVSKEVTRTGNTTYHLEQIDPLIIESSSRILPSVKATVAAEATPSRPTAMPSWPELSQAQLNALQRDMEAKGYSITQPLNQSGGIGTSGNGSTFYKGAITQNGLQYNLTVEVFKDNATANSQFPLTVGNLQKLGIVGSYTSSTQWTGVSTFNGIQVSSSVTKSATGPPYTITTIE